MKVHIVNYEIGVKKGILTKYADQMVNGLIRLGHEVTVSNKPDQKADVNHHINYQSYQSCKGVNTTMVTHLDTPEKVAKMKEVAKEAHGICFSKETLDFLVSEGVSKKKLSVVHPATNVVRRPRIVAIMTQLYPDGRKREGMFPELLKTLDPAKFSWNIVGEGWGEILNAVEGKHGILYQEHYTGEIGQSILNNADYLLYFGKDEGAISVLDASMAGVKTIAPNVGFHKEIGIDYPFDTQEELNEIFKKLSENPVESWTWSEYVKQHVKIWEKLVK